MTHDPHAPLRPLAVAVHAALLCAAFTLPPAHAAEPGAGAAAQASRSYDIPPGPLAEALSRYAAAAGVTLAFDAGQLRELRTGGLQGSHTVAAGFARLLAGSGFEAVPTAEGRYTLRRLPAAAGEATLPAVTVKASAATDTAFEGSAAEGYRVSRSAVAGFTERPIKDTPFSVKVVPAELMRNRGANEIDELDKYDASVTNATATTGWYSAPAIRGLDLHNWSNYRYNGLTIVNQQAVGLENKERVEVLKGLAGLQGGFATPGGLINYVTKRPEDVTAVHLYANEYGNVRAHADVGRLLGDNFGLRINVAGEEERSHVHHVDGGRFFASLAADWRITPDTLLAFDIEHERRNQHSIPALQLDSGGELPDVDPETFLGQSWSRYPTENTIVSGKLSHRLNDRWSVSGAVNFAYLKRDQNNIYLRNIQPDGAADVFLYFSPDQTREPANAKLMVNGAFDTAGIRHDLAFGYTHSRLSARWGDGFFGNIGTTNLHDPVAIAEPSLTDSAYRAVRWRENGVFANDVLAFGTQWDLHLGGRYAHIDRRFFRADGSAYGEYDDATFTPSAALVFKPRTDLSLYLSYVEGLEQGGSAPVGTTNANDQMPPLVSEQVEAGVKGESGALNWEASLFRISKPAEYTRTNADATTTFVQEGEQVHTGLEVSVAGKLAREITLFGSAMWLDAELEKTGNPATQGNRPVGVPRHRIALTAEYAPGVLPGWTFAANWTRSGDRAVNATNTAFASAYDVVSFGVRHDRKIAGKDTTFRVNVDNVFDEGYWGTVYNNYLVSGAPRSVWGSVSVSF